MVGGAVLVTSSQEGQVVAIGPEAEMDATFSMEDGFICGRSLDENKAPLTDPQSGQPLYQCMGPAQSFQPAFKKTEHSCSLLPGQNDQPSPGVLCSSARRFGDANAYTRPPITLKDVVIREGEDYGDEEPVKANAPAAAAANVVVNGVHHIPVVTDAQGRRQVDFNQLWGVLDQQAWFKGYNGETQVQEANRIHAAMNGAITEGYDYVPLDLSHVAAPNTGTAGKGAATLDEIQIVVDVDPLVAKADDAGRQQHHATAQNTNNHHRANRSSAAPAGTVTRATGSSALL